MTQIIQNQSPQGPFRSSYELRSCEVIRDNNRGSGDERRHRPNQISSHGDKSGMDFYSMKLKNGFMIEMN